MDRVRRSRIQFNKKPLSCSTELTPLAAWHNRATGMQTPSLSPQQTVGASPIVRGLLVCFAVSLAIGGLPLTTAADLTAGAARAEISPSTNVLNWVDHKPYPGVLDPVFVRATVVSDGANRVALIAWDVTDTREGFVAKVRAAVSRATGIPGTNILITASHTHSAPWVPSENDSLLEAERRTLLPVQNGPGYSEWAENLITRTVAAAKQADKARKPVTLSIARAWAGDLVFNRRPIREDGKVETSFTPADPYSLPHGERFGPVDPTLTLLGFVDASGASLSTLFTLPCHPVSIYPHDPRVSADWPGPVSARLSAAFGGEASFFQGCAGDIVPVRRGLPPRDKMAELIGDRALAAWTNRHLIQSGSLQALVVPVRLPLNDAARQDTGKPAFDSEVQLITYGSLAIVAIPGEPLTGLGMEIQRRSPYPHTVVLGYSNGGGVQYVGSTGDKRKGGYEMGVAGAGEDRCGQIIINAACQALAVLRSEQLLASTPREQLHLYLLIGQSNMAGRGTVEAADEVPHPRVLSLDPIGRWRMAIDPLHQDKPSAGLGLGSWFGRGMADATPEAVIGLIPAAVGGTPLSRWMRGGDLYQHAVEQAKLAQAQGVLKGILWHQGENDSDTEEHAKSYAARLAQVIADLRKDLEVADVPFVAGKLGEFLVSEPRLDTPQAGLVNSQLTTLTQRVTRFGLVESANLTSMPDKIHFDSPSLREFGRRYAERMKQLLSSPSKN